MSPKTAIKILSITVLVLVVAFSIFWYYSKKQNESILPGFKTEEEEAAAVDEIITKKNQGVELNENEQKTLDGYVDEKVIEKRAELEIKPEEEIKESGYTQDEVDFILDPERTVEKDLGITQEKKVESLSQEEIDKILNP